MIPPDADAAPALEMAGVFKAFEGRRVLEEVHLAVAPRETVAVAGVNGSGKSTLLRIAATLVRPDAGVVRITGIAAAQAPESARRAQGMTLQDAPVYAELTCAEHLAWWARVQGCPATTPAEAGLAAVADQPAARLSRGQRQRLALAMALAPAPPLLLLDEPWAHLDAAGRAWLEARLRERAGRAATLIACQDGETAAGAPDRVLRLDAGRLA